ncbi:MAG: hypothetical protein V7L27_31100 [Nostoc sp.]|uniref:hypothetical protein n=1 Tax=Nostoc sp. TaxID=1180 RepID=UPI002FF4A1AF
MEHWQFLIQKQGARSWHILESPNLEISEGQYRILARSNLLNTDVEVRVTHSSTHEVQPTRRIFKRSRRTNSEGLMAVIPFTYFQAGVWELRCSGDLMSDLMGKYWQYKVQVQVLSQEEEEAKQREKAESNLLVQQNTISENLECTALAKPDAIAVTAEVVIRELESTIPAEPAINLDNAIAIPAEITISGELESTVPAELAITLDNAIAVTAELESTVPAEPAITLDNAIAIPAEIAISGELESTVPAEPAINLDNAIAVTAESAITGELESTVPAETAITLDNAIAVTAEIAISGELESTVPAETAINLDNAIAVTAELAITGELESTVPAETAINLDNAIAVTAELAITGELESTVPTEPAINLDNAIAVSAESAIVLYSNPITIVLPDEGNLEDTAPAEPLIGLDQAIAVPAELATTDNKTVTTVLPDETEENIASEEPVSTMWLKGETVEQILQNLIDLALPASELLPNDENVTDFLATQLPPPLLLTLDQDNYIAPWGQALAINGYIEPKENTNLDQAETLSPKRLRALELGIELRSPNNSKILTKVRQILPDQELPFSINTSINIPADCESKLILADISLYGKFADAGEVIRLASQSFTITADITELLAITAAAKPSTDAIPSDSSAAFIEPETPVRLDLKLLNLVKMAKTDQSQIVNPSPNTPLPPQINLQALREATLRTSKLKNSGNSPQLPKLPPIQSDANIPADIVAEQPIQEELLEKDANIAAINLEQLVIKQRRMPIFETTLPYLRRLQTLPGDTEEVKKNVLPDALKVQGAEDLPQLDAIVPEDENTPELVVADVPSQEEFVAEVEAPQNEPSQEESVAEVEPQTNAQFITTGNLYSSPLLRKWMQSQGYSLPESINDLQRQDYDNYEPAQQTPLSLSAKTANVDVNLPLNLDTNTETWREQGTWEEVQDLADELSNFGEDIDIAQEADLGIRENTELEKAILSSALSTQIPPPPPPIKTNIASAWLAQEIVVDDTDSELEADLIRGYTFEKKEQPLLNLSPSLPIITAATKVLPIPQLHVPEGELIAGKFIIVRVVLPEVPPQVVIKLWVEDYQTRWLLDGPHLLTNLLPNASGGLEVMTQLNIPFGCLEIRLEAIALDLTTQQESHKVTILRTVIPPDLPDLQLDELLGI